MSIKDSIVAAINESVDLVMSAKSNNYQDLTLEVYKKGTNYSVVLKNKDGQPVSFTSLYHKGPLLHSGHDSIRKSVGDEVRRYAEKSDKPGLLKYLKVISGDDWK